MHHFEQLVNMMISHAKSSYAFGCTIHILYLNFLCVSKACEYTYIDITKCTIYLMI